MSTQVIWNQLRREAAANKGKAAVLGSVCCVAMYFWVPLVLGWFKSEQPPQDASLVVATDAVTTSTSAAPLVPAVTSAAKQEHAWYDLAHWISTDPLMRSAELPVGTRDLFQLPKPKAVKIDSTEVTADNKPAPIDLEQMGLTLTSTMVGSNRAVVQINGKSLAVPIDALGRPTRPTTFNFAQGESVHQLALLEVRPGSVVLKHDRKVHVLNIKRPQLAGNDDIEFLWFSN